MLTAIDHPVGPETDDRHPVMWLACYAMGIASAARAPMSRLQDLVTAADACPEQLSAARRLLATFDVVDESIRTDARRLLRAAMLRVDAEVGRG